MSTRRKDSDDTEEESFKVLSCSSKEAGNGVLAKKYSRHMEREMTWHIDTYQFPVMLTVKDEVSDSCKINCSVCDRWISVSGMSSKDLHHLRDHFKTPLYQSNIELHASRVEKRPTELPMLKINESFLTTKYPNIFSIIGTKAQCSLCLKDGVIEMLPKTGSFQERVCAHVNSRCHSKMVEKCSGKGQGLLKFKSTNDL